MNLGELLLQLCDFTVFLLNHIDLALKVVDLRDHLDVALTQIVVKLGKFSVTSQVYVLTDAILLGSFELSFKFFNLKFEFGELSLGQFRILYLALELETDVLELFFSLGTHLFQYKIALRNFLVNLLFLLFVRLDQSQKGSLLMSLHINHQLLILDL